MSDEIDIRKIVTDTFDKIGARPKTLIINNVAIKKGETLTGLYCVGDKPITSINENIARTKMETGDQLYKVEIYRVE